MLPVTPDSPLEKYLALRFFSDHVEERISKAEPSVVLLDQGRCVAFRHAVEAIWHAEGFT